MLKKAFQYCFFTLLLLTYSQCNNSEPQECPNIENLPYTAEVNGKNLFLQNIEVRENFIPGLDTHLFIISAVSSNCNQVLKFQFYASVPNSEDLDGAFDIVETIVYTEYQLTSFTYAIETIEPLNFNIRYATGGQATIKKHADKEYTIEIRAELPENDEVRLKVRHQF